MLRTSFRGKHTENAGTTANIKDNLALEKGGVVQDGIAVRASADRIFQHLLVNA